MNNIARLRKLKNLSQALLAEMCGVEQSTISKAENSAGGVSLRTYEQIAEALDAPLAVLFKDDTSEAELRLLEMFRAASDDQKKMLLGLARAALDDDAPANR